jgi:hypothetical protein
LVYLIFVSLVLCSGFVDAQTRLTATGNRTSLFQAYPNLKTQESRVIKTVTLGLGKRLTFRIMALALPLLLSLGCRSAPPKGLGPGTASSVENYPNLTARAKELEEALSRKDYGKVVDLTYPKLIEYAGGREKLLAAMTKELETMEAEGVEIISSTASAPSQFLYEANGIYAVVPITSKFKAKDGVFQVEGSLIAISSDGGQNWTFVDSTGKDQTELKKVIPSLDKLKLPPEKEPVKVTN